MTLKTLSKFWEAFLLQAPLLSWSRAGRSLTETCEQRPNPAVEQIVPEPLRSQLHGPHGAQRGCHLGAASPRPQHKIPGLPGAPASKALHPVREGATTIDRFWKSSEKLSALPTVGEIFSAPLMERNEQIQSNSRLPRTVIRVCDETLNEMCDSLLITLNDGHSMPGRH